MNKPIFTLILTALFLTSTVNAKETNLRAGLWEIRTSSDLLQLAEHVPPDQLKGIQDLADQYGVEMPQLDNGAAVSYACITETMAKQKKLPIFYQEELGCRSNEATRRGNQYHIHYRCDSKQLKGKGQAKGIITSSNSFKAVTVFKGMAQGLQVNEQADIQGKWLKSNCGNVKPL